MKEYIKKILDKLFCLHQYELFKEHRASQADDWGNVYKTYTKYIFMCSKCGKFKKIRS